MVDVALDVDAAHRRSVDSAESDDTTRTSRMEAGRRPPPDGQVDSGSSPYPGVVLARRRSFPGGPEFLHDVDRHVHCDLTPELLCGVGLRFPG
jgi:hypothetical protein